MNKKTLLGLFKIEDPFESFDRYNENSAIKGWNGNTNLLPDHISTLKPTLIVEVGSWLGMSAVNMAHAVKNQGLDNTAVVCIDTWLGSLEHWIDDECRKTMKLESGRPSYYNDFMSNIVKEKLQDVVLPLPITSTAGLRFLKHHGLSPELIFLDGSNETDELYTDLKNAYEILAKNGAIIGTSWDWHTVQEAVMAFSAEEGCPYLTANNVFWSIRKR